MTLVDTSVWVEHLRHGNERLRSMLEADHVVCHPFVVGELACGNLRNRQEILGLLAALPEARLADHHEVLHLMESRRLYGCGLDWIDAHLLASALLTDCDVWTRDRPLKVASARLGFSA